MDRDAIAEQLLRDYAETFGTPGGKRVLADLAILGRINSSCYVDQNPHATSYHEGMRCVILHIQSMIMRTTSNVERQTKAKGKENTNNHKVPRQQENPSLFCISTVYNPIIWNFYRKAFFR